MDSEGERVALAVERAKINAQQHEVAELLHNAETLKSDNDTKANELERKSLQLAEEQEAVQFRSRLVNDDEARILDAARRAEEEIEEREQAYHEHLQEWGG